MSQGYVPPANCVALTRYFYPVSERLDSVLACQMEKAEDHINRVVTHPLQSYQREALICLVSDVVAGLVFAPATTFENSFLVTALNKGMFQIAAAEFYTFCYVYKKVQTRAWEKRRAEAFLFTTGRMLFEEEGA